MSDLRTSIMTQVEEALDDILADEAGDQSQRKADMISHAQNVIDACTTKELESGRALESFLDTLKRNARVKFYNL